MAGRKRKTIARLERLKLSKPKHFVDTCILIEVLTKENKQLARQCARYIARLGKTYQGVISIPVMGEYTNTFIIEDLSIEKLVDYFSFLQRLLKEAQLSLVSPRFTTLTIVDKIRKIDDRVEFMDALHVACAMENGIKVFVTFDPVLVRNERLEEAFGIRLQHPKELV